MDKHNTKILWIAVALMIAAAFLPAGFLTWAPIPLSILLFSALHKHMQEKKQLGHSIEKLKEEYEATEKQQRTWRDEANYEFAAQKLRAEKELEKIHADQDELIQQYKERAKFEAREELSRIEKEIPRLQAELSELKLEVENGNKTVASNANKVQRLQTQAKALRAMLSKFDDSDSLDGRLIDETDELLSVTVELRLHYMDVRQLKALFNQNKKIITDTLKKYESRYTTKTFSTMYKLMVLALEAELQNILFGLRFGKLDAATKNVKTMTSKYQKLASDGNQSIAPTVTKFIGEIEYLYTEAVKIEYEYYTKKEAIKEEQRALREQMRQEAEERKRLEQEQKRIAAEEEKYKNELQSLLEQMEAADEAQKLLLQKRVDEVNAQLEDVEHKKEEIAKLQHGKAGYVYVVSNLGSFGGDVFKIGMTRRLQPQERIAELSGASVPFPFDVHSFIFSDDAVGLENAMHKTLHKNRLNKVNLRKEFFKVELEELESLVFDLQPTAEFTSTMLAEQYNQGLSMDDIPDDWVLGDDEDEMEIEDFEV